MSNAKLIVGEATASRLHYNAAHFSLDVVWIQVISLPPATLKSLDNATKFSSGHHQALTVCNQ
jgi:hypothetical protein